MRALIAVKLLQIDNLKASYSTSSACQLHLINSSALQRFIPMEERSLEVMTTLKDLQNILMESPPVKVNSIQI